MGAFQFVDAKNTRQAVNKEPNPYSPASMADIASSGRSRLRAVLSFAAGFFGGTALQWVLFWTDSFSTGFPPLGGALLGLLSVLAIHFPGIRSRPALLLVGAIFGNLNAFWCNRAPLLYRDIPRDVVTSWGFASIAFALTFAFCFVSVRWARRIIWIQLSSRQLME
ncbi:hypothetical protein Mal65_02710 [Crateriforma conspicua]|nr:hypothetical protein Mal65_02710 [Crateriforma conspicua]